jgi:UDP-N-acetylmuramoyl-tripeptide--D-alanyl-D-alanine ligase
MLFDLHQVASLIHAELLGDGSVFPSALSLDTRTLQPGECFVALHAGRDGHTFAAKAVELGAACLLVDHFLNLPVPQLIVPDTLVALQSWGQARLKEVRPHAVFAVTGSVGKTSTKDLLAAATGGWKTPGNHNNTLGLPQALATMPLGESAAVLEMGMSTPGEIQRLTEIAPPDFGVITLIGTSHIENFPNGQQGIARAKGELIAGLPPGGVWVHLATDPWCRWISEQSWAAREMAVPVGDGEDFGWKDIESMGPHGMRFTLCGPEYELPIKLKLHGAHQVRNASLAAAIALLAGFDRDQVAAGMSSVEPEAGRGRLHALAGGGWLLDESYNASSDSIMACAESLLELKGGEPVAVLGCIRELGESAERIHREVGEGLRALGLERIWVYGDYSDAMAQGFGAGANSFPDFDSMRDDSHGLSAIPDGSRILVKGSRYWTSEQAVAWLLDHKGMV